MWRDELYPTAHVAEAAARQTLGASPAITNMGLQHQNLLSLTPLPLLPVCWVITCEFVPKGTNADHHDHHFT